MEAKICYIAIFLYVTSWTVRCSTVDRLVSDWLGQCIPPPLRHCVSSAAAIRRHNESMTMRSGPELNRYWNLFRGVRIVKRLSPLSECDPIKKIGVSAVLRVEKYEFVSHICTP